ncbi:MAG: hypothetical protein R3D85_13360 [Paracoccaceae bacterium]
MSRRACATLLASLSALSTATLVATPLAAQTLLTGNYVIDGRLCVGPDCGLGETFGDSDFKVKSIYPFILMDDSSTGSGSTNDWSIQANDINWNYFAIENETNNAVVFRIDGTAPQSSLAIGTDGNVGLGTALPQDELHIVSADGPAIRLEQDATISPPYTWSITGSDVSMSIRDVTQSKTPVFIGSGTPSYMFVTTPTGVGIGGGIPYSGSATLEVKSPNDDSNIRVEAASGITAPRTLLTLLNNGRPEIVMGNTDTGANGASAPAPISSSSKAPSAAPRTSRPSSSRSTRRATPP